MIAQVDCQDLSRLNFVKYIKPGVSLYTLIVWSCCLNCQIFLACISEVQANGKIKNALLFSTDIHLPPEQIVEYYQARFQIEFIFLDDKQFTGLSDCQARHLPRLNFHFNASLIALNLAKHELSSCHIHLPNHLCFLWLLINAWNSISIYFIPLLISYI
ncbi:transposase [Microcoleus sp. herbarium19]|uniref:transposase n=1 Tax=Microcoleus sp. herbarium19 TaxID=3055440 RepID=UPI002FD3ADE6